jgi:hypothetical protein
MTEIVFYPGTETRLARQKEIEQLGDEITELAAHIHAATYKFLVLIREFDERSGWSCGATKSCAHWLNYRCGIGLGAAREKVRVAHAMKDLPLICEAFRKGEVSYSKVRAMTRVATPKNEDRLMNIAAHGTASHVEQAVRYYRRHQRSEALLHENRRHALRELNWYHDDDGTWVFRGRFTPEQGALLEQALSAVMHQAWEERKDVPAETPEDHIEYRPEPIAAQRADAMERLAEVYLADTGQDRSGGERYMVNIHTEAETLREDGAGAESEVENCGCVSAETSRRMACDASVVHWREDEEGEPLSIGRKSRTIPRAIKRALKRRDAGCRFPGCTCSRFVDAHHIHHWADGGETRLNNLVLLCRHHHRMVHEGGYGVRMLPSGNVEFTWPDGARMPFGPDTRFRGNVFEMEAQNRQAGIEITPETTVPYWLGESMDCDMAVEGLIQRE